MKKNHRGADPMTRVLAEVSLNASRKVLVATTQSGSRRMAIPALSQIKGMVRASRAAARGRESEVVVRSREELRALFFGMRLLQSGGLDAADVFLSARIDLEAVARLYKEGYLHFQSGLQDGGFLWVVCRVSFDAL